MMPAVDAQSEPVAQDLPVPDAYCQWLQAGQIVNGDARTVLARIQPATVDLSFWSPPYWVGKSYEQHLDFPRR